jgi:hypothetical protein
VKGNGVKTGTFVILELALLAPPPGRLIWAGVS